LRGLGHVFLSLQLFAMIANQALHANSRPPSTLDAQAGFGHLHCAHRWLTTAVGELGRSANCAVWISLARRRRIRLSVRRDSRPGRLHAPSLHPALGRSPRDERRHDGVYAGIGGRCGLPCSIGVRAIATRTPNQTPDRMTGPPRQLRNRMSVEGQSSVSFFVRRSSCVSVRSLRSLWLPFFLCRKERRETQRALRLGSGTVECHSQRRSEFCRRFLTDGQVIAEPGAAREQPPAEYARHACRVRSSSLRSPLVHGGCR
jgi:hypothetical protein